VGIDRCLICLCVYILAMLWGILYYTYHTLSILVSTDISEGKKNGMKVSIYLCQGQEVSKAWVLS